MKNRPIIVISDRFRTTSEVVAAGSQTKDTYSIYVFYVTPQAPGAAGRHLLLRNHCAACHLVQRRAEYVIWWKKCNMTSSLHPVFPDHLLMCDHCAAIYHLNHQFILSGKKRCFCLTHPIQADVQLITLALNGPNISKHMPSVQPLT
jgi:hypothetical protein